MAGLFQLTAEESLKKIRSGNMSAEECVLSCFERICVVEERVHSFVTLNKDGSIERAKRIDENVSRGKSLGRLAGVTVAVKDNICTKGIRTTCSSRTLERFVPPYNATVVKRIEREGGIIIGKTNMDEFAMGSSTESSYFGPTHNPWDLSTVPGGSSGGSGAAVVSDETIMALGSDTGGSIRCPASYCSIVGLKPTYGLISRYGLIAYANSLEQIGPMAKNVYDCALLLSVIAGHDPKDSTSVKTGVNDYTKCLKNDIETLRIGLPIEFFGEGISEDVKEHVWRAVLRLQELGAYYEETSIPSLEYALSAYYIIAMSEASSNLARYDGIRYGHSLNNEGNWSTLYSKNRRFGFGDEVRRRIILGTYALSAGYYKKYYLKALKARTLIRKEFQSAFKKFDVLIAPSMPTPPFKIGEKIQDPIALYMCDVLTVPANLTGYPAISIPCGFSRGLPIGMQVIAPPFREDLILQVGYAFEKNTTYKNKKPRLK